MTTNSLTIKLETLTPLWTGGADGKSDRLHITGIMGSLRWWYEVLVRSVGGRVCPVDKHCIYKQEEPDQGLCDVCRIFGATGWARRFKLIVSEENLQPKKPMVRTTIDRSERRVFTLSRDHPANHDPKWYLSSDPLYGDVTLEIITTLPLEEKGKELLDPKIIGALIQLIADRGSIGAKPQMGLGVVRVNSWRFETHHTSESLGVKPQMDLDVMHGTGRQSIQPLLRHLKQLVAKHEHHNDELPSLHNMFFARVKVDRASATESATFDLKYDIRGMFRQAFKNVDLRHTIMGSVSRGDRQGAKIMMSYPYDNGIIRIWGWIPKVSTHPSRNEILDEIYSLLEDIYRDNFSYWLDFKPKKHGDIVKYLEEHLLKEEK